METTKKLSNISQSYIFKYQFLRITVSIFILSLTCQVFSQSKAESEIINLSNTKFHWQLEEKLDSLSNLFDDNIIIQHASGKIQSKNEYLETLKSGMLAYKKIDVKENNVRIFGKTAVLIGKVDFSITLNGEKKNFNFSYTEVYGKNKKGWSLVLYAFQKITQ
jgi:hypothetical protein